MDIKDDDNCKDAIAMHALGKAIFGWLFFISINSKITNVFQNDKTPFLGDMQTIQPTLYYLYLDSG